MPHQKRLQDLNEAAHTCISGDSAGLPRDILPLLYAIFGCQRTCGKCRKCPAFHYDLSRSLSMNVEGEVALPGM